MSYNAMSLFDVQRSILGCVSAIRLRLMFEVRFMTTEPVLLISALLVRYSGRGENSIHKRNILRIV